MDHSTLHHKKVLSELCRICANRAQSHKERRSKKSPYLVKNYRKGIKDYFDICTDNDNQQTHPDKLCTSCFGHLTRFIKNHETELKNQKVKSRKAKLINTVWHENDDMQCQVCSLYEQQNAIHRNFRVSLFDILEANSVQCIHSLGGTGDMSGVCPLPTQNDRIGPKQPEKNNASNDSSLNGISPIPGNLDTSETTPKQALNGSSLGETGQKQSELKSDSNELSLSVSNDLSLSGISPLPSGVDTSETTPKQALNGSSCSETGQKQPELNSASNKPSLSGFRPLPTPFGIRETVSEQGHSHLHTNGTGPKQSDLSIASNGSPLGGLSSGPTPHSTPIRHMPYGHFIPGILPSPVQHESPFSEYPLLSAFASPSNSMEMINGVTNSSHKRKEDLPRLSPGETNKMHEYILRYRAHADDPDLIKLKSGSKPLSYHFIPENVKSAEEASGRTLRRRAKLSEKIRKISKSKLSKELSRLPDAQKSMECKEAGVHAPHFTPTEDLAMRSYAGLSGVQYDKIKKFEATKGIKRSTVITQRALKKSVLGNFLETKPCQFTFKDENSPYSVNGYITKSLPLCIVKDLTQFTLHRINENHKLGRLTWHGGGIPENEIWVKIPGDKGGGSTKMGVQLVNIAKPNSPENTAIVCQYEASDSHANLKSALSGMAEQIEELKRTKWNGKELKVFGGGDYDWISKFNRIAGASGTCPCYLCLIPKSEMQFPPRNRKHAHYPARTLKHLQEQYFKFMKSGGKRAEQSKFFNVIYGDIFQIEPNMWVIPILHITLGTVKKIHVMLLVVCHGLGIDIANQLARLTWPVGSTKYDEYISMKAELLICEERILEICDEIVDLKEQNESEDLSLDKVRENEARMTELKTQEAKMRKEMANLESKITVPGVDSDPVSACLDETLQKHGIKRQAYHGKSFVGNHCHKYLREEVYQSVTAGIVKQCELLTGDPDIIDEAKEIEAKFNEIFRLYREVYIARIVSPATQLLLEMAVTQVKFGMPARRPVLKNPVTRPIQRNLYLFY